MYTFVNRCNEELLEFLKYIQNTTDEFARHAKGELVREIQKKVNVVKSDQRIEVEYMTLLERDRVEEVIKKIKQD